MTLGNTITHYRKAKNITQESLAQQLGVTNQAVSKWETDQCCPDVMLLPKLADIFGISIDILFGREAPASARIPGLPWEDDDTLRVVLYAGHQLLGSSSAVEKLTFTYEGPALNVDSSISVSCGNVSGNVTAGAHVSCGNVEGSIDAGANVNCGNVSGSITAGANIKCGSIGGRATAGCFIDSRK